MAPGGSAGEGRSGSRASRRAAGWVARTAAVLTAAGGRSATTAHESAGVRVAAVGASGLEGKMPARDGVRRGRLLGIAPRDRAAQCVSATGVGRGRGHALQSARESVGELATGAEAAAAAGDGAAAAAAAAVAVIVVIAAIVVQAGAQAGAGAGVAAGVAATEVLANAAHRRQTSPQRLHSRQKKRHGRSPASLLYPPPPPQ